jgi:hypothetical protein
MTVAGTLCALNLYLEMPISISEIRTLLLYAMTSSAKQSSTVYAARTDGSDPVLSG